MNNFENQNDCYVDSIGIQFVVDTGVDITNADYIALNVKKPQGSKVVWIPTTYETTVMSYTTIKGDLNEIGIYYLQVEIRFGTKIFFGETTAFLVKESYS